jgi:Abhydrolase family
MLDRTRAVVLASIVAGVMALPASAQVRVTPKESKGGKVLGEPWADVPDVIRQSLHLPQWPIPTDLQQWEQTGRAKTRATLVGLLGDLPPRPDPAHVKVTAKEDHDGYTLERFEFHNGVDAVVPGIILIPKDRRGRVPAIVGLHGHGSTKESICTDEVSSQLIGPMMARKGYVVAAIDGYFSGDRVGRGPAVTKNAGQQEDDFFKLNMWLGRNLWGMMLRDEQCLIDYLQTRPEVDPDAIGVTGMSMGCTRSWWLAAIDDRVKAVVGVACFTRYTELIAHGHMKYHGIYYWVPGVLKHFDTEAINALIAPRPHLELTGDQDGGAPIDGVEVLEHKLAQVYALYGKPGNFRSVVYKNTGHEYLPEMKVEMVAWFQKHLPVGK